MFFRTLRIQLYQLVHRKGFQVGFVLVLLYCLATNIEFILLGIGQERQAMIATEWLFSGNFGCTYLPLFNTLFPFLVPLAFATSGVSDNLNRILPIVASRTSPKTYYSAKMTACFVGAFLMLLLPMLINILINFVSFPQESFRGLYNVNAWAPTGIDSLGNYVQDSDVWLLPGLFYRSGFVWNLAHALLYGVLAGAGSCFAYACSLSIKKYTVAAFVPFALFLWLTQTVNVWTRNTVDPSTMAPKTPIIVDPMNYVMGADVYQYKYITIFILYIALLLGVSAALLSRRARADQLN